MKKYFKLALFFGFIGSIAIPTIGNTNAHAVDANTECGLATDPGDQGSADNHTGVYFQYDHEYNNKEGVWAQLNSSSINSVDDVMPLYLAYKDTLNYHLAHPNHPGWCWKNVKLNYYDDGVTKKESWKSFPDSSKTPYHTEVKKVIFKYIDNMETEKPYLIDEFYHADLTPTDSTQIKCNYYAVGMPDKVEGYNPNQESMIARLHNQSKCTDPTNTIGTVTTTDTKDITTTINHTGPYTNTYTEPTHVTITSGTITNTTKSGETNKTNYEHTVTHTEPTTHTTGTYYNTITNTIINTTTVGTCTETKKKGEATVTVTETVTETVNVANESVC